MLYCYCVALLLFVLSNVLIVCTVPLPPGVNPIAVDNISVSIRAVCSGSWHSSMCGATFRRLLSPVQPKHVAVGIIYNARVASVKTAGVTGIRISRKEPRLSLCGALHTQFGTNVLQITKHLCTFIGGDIRQRVRYYAAYSGNYRRFGTAPQPIRLAQRGCPKRR